MPMRGRDSRAGLGLEQAAEGRLDPATVPGSRIVRLSTLPRAWWDAAATPREGEAWVLRVGRRHPWVLRAADLVWAVAATLAARALWDGGTWSRAAAVVLATTAVLAVVDICTPTPGARRAKVAG
jgi:hypothetical protein